MEQRLSLVTLGVSDLRRARRFYEDLGWEGAQQPDEEVCFFQVGGMVFGLWTALGGHGAPGLELAYNVRSPEEVAAVLTEAEQAGGTIMEGRASGVGWHDWSLCRSRWLRVGGCAQLWMDHPPGRFHHHLTRRRAAQASATN
ncbi:MAG TPA: VOC family protein [Acidimicrobiales bacterium]|nr:VOC family protein [Acidimicrobiales bacterium]